jgi:hypothetical protein
MSDPLIVMRSYDFGKMGLVLRNTSYFDAWKDGHLIGEFDTLNRAVYALLLRSGLVTSEPWVMSSIRNAVQRSTKKGMRP